MAFLHPMTIWFAKGFQWHPHQYNPVTPPSTHTNTHRLLRLHLRNRCSSATSDLSSVVTTRRDYTSILRHSLQKNQTETLKLNIQLLGQLFQAKIDPMQIIALLFHLFHPANGLWLLAMMARDLSRNPMWFPCADAALPDRTSSVSHASWPSG